MAFLQRVSSIVAPPRMKAETSNGNNYVTAFFSGEDLPGSWTSTLSAAGVNVTPELAMTLSAYYCGVTTIAYDLATLPLQTFKWRPDGGKDVIRGGSFSNAAGIGALAYRLRWQPNTFQSAAEYFVGQIAQLLLRGRAYAEIVPGPTGAIDQLLPRHPDRVFPERLASGNIRYKLIEANGQPRYVTQDEMHVVRDVSTDPAASVSRVQYGANAIGTALASERAAARFFAAGMAASTVATYTGDMEDEDEKALYNSIMRYASGVENSFGLLLIPDDVKISNLAVDPEKAQMMLAREWGVREVARQLRIPLRKLMVSQTSTYASAYQDQIDYAVGCIRPISRIFEQAMQRDLIMASDTYSVQFDIKELLRGDPAQMGEFIEKVITNRAMRPSEVRMQLLDLNPDADLDRLSEGDNRGGAPDQVQQPKNAPPQNQNARMSVKGMLAVHDAALRCLRRERAAVEKLARKHPSDVAAWQGALRDFFADQSQFIAQVMRMPISVARSYCAQHGAVLEAKGIIVHTDEWERSEADELCALALESPYAEGMAA